MIAEGDPPPGTSGGAVGRMSFGGYSAAVDQLQAAAAASEQQDAAAAAEAANPGGKSVSDEAMAASMSKHRESGSGRHSRPQDGSRVKGKKKRRGDGGGDERGEKQKQSRGRYF